jgi:ankyrin repeat protein
LLAAAWKGNAGVATQLLAAGADPDMAAANTYTPLLAAAVRGDRPMVQLLLAHHATPTPKVRPNVPTPADAARLAHHPDVAALLDHPR